MRKLILMTLLAFLAACTDEGPIAPDGPDAPGPEFAKSDKCPDGPPCGKGGGGGGGGGGALPSDVAAIAFVRNGDLVVMNADGSNQTVVYSGSGRGATPSWSPDEKSIVFHESVTEGEGWISRIESFISDNQIRQRFGSGK